jgi:hypothetical protein
MFRVWMFGTRQDKIAGRTMPQRKMAKRSGMKTAIRIGGYILGLALIVTFYSIGVVLAKFITQYTAWLWSLLD